MKNGKFHHGNLRAELIAAATETLSNEGAEKLSLRDLAAQLGVSRAAPYRHFASKEELLQAVAVDGLESLTLAYELAEALDAPPKERLRAACKAYLDVAQRNPGLFDLIFFTEGYVERIAGSGTRTRSAFAIFERLVAGALGLTGPDRQRLAALAAWSQLHGFAILRMQGHVQRFADPRSAEEAVLDLVCGIVSAGGGARSC